MFCERTETPNTHFTCLNEALRPTRQYVPHFREELKVDPRAVRPCSKRTPCGWATEIFQYCLSSFLTPLLNLGLLEPQAHKTFYERYTA